MINISHIIFPDFFQPMANTLAIVVTLSVVIDTIAGTRFFYPDFFCYALAGSYVISMFYEAVSQLRQRAR